MFSPKKLKRIQHRKRLIVAESDLLRGETGELWDAAMKRSAGKVGPLRRLRPYSPILFTVSLAALRLTRAKLGPRHRLAGKACSVAGYLLGAMRPTPPTPPQETLE